MKCLVSFKKKVAPLFGSILARNTGTLPPNSGKDQKEKKKVFAANRGYVRPEFRIYSVHLDFVN